MIYRRKSPPWPTPAHPGASWCRSDSAVTEVRGPRAVRSSITSSKWLTAHQMVEADNDQRIADGDFPDEPGEGRAGARGAGAVLLDDGLAAGGAQLHFLSFRGLFVRGDARIADKPSLWSSGSAILRVSGHPERLRVRFGAVFQTQRIRITDRLKTSLELAVPVRMRSVYQRGSGHSAFAHCASSPGDNRFFSPCWRRST